MGKKTPFPKKERQNLEDGFASCAIENMPFTFEEREYLLHVVEQGKTSDEMVAIFKKDMGALLRPV